MSNPESHQEWIAEQFSPNFSSAIEMMTGAAPEILAHVQIPSGSKLAWWEYVLSGFPDTSIRFGITEADAIAIGAFSLKAAGVDDPPEEESVNTFLEVLTQAVSAICRSLSQQFGREVNAEQANRLDSSPFEPPTETFSVKSDPDFKAEIAVTLTSNLIDLLERSMRPAAASSSGASAPQSDGPALPRNSNTMELLLEVELPVSVSFGRSFLALRDVLKLTTGSIVELNRSISEPVEIVVNNRTIAFGEVVVVEGNYGVRIRHIVSKQERLRSIQ